MRRLFLLVLVCALVTGCNRQELFSNVSQREANEMATVLERTGIDAQIKAGTEAGRVTITVPSGDIASATRVLARVGLPRPKKTPLSEVLPQDNWMASRGQENARLAYGIGQDLSATITQIAGVREARVHVALAETNAIGQRESQPSASVLVRYDAALVNPQLQYELATIVANAVPGLTFERVSVLMVPDRGDVAYAKDEPVHRPSVVPAVPDWLRLGAPLLLLAGLAMLVYTRARRFMP